MGRTKLFFVGVVVEAINEDSAYEKVLNACASSALTRAAHLVTKPRLLDRKRFRAQAREYLEAFHGAREES